MQLFRIEPFGLETDEVESLSSYLLRLAKVHGVTLGRLLTTLKTDYQNANPGWIDYSETHANPQTLATLVRPTDSVADLLRIIESVTGDIGLRATTFQALRHACYRSVGLFHGYLRWCPECFTEDVRAGGQAYYRLIWSFKDVEFCHKHGAPIISRCPKCYRRQNSVNRRKAIHRCFKCSTELTCRHTDEVVAEAADVVSYSDLLDLTRWVASKPQLEFREGDARKLLQAIFDRVWDLEEEREFWKILPKEQSLMISYSDKKLTMSMLRRIAYRLGISLPGLLAGEVECWTAQLEPRWLENLPVSMVPAKRRKKHDRNAVLERIQECLSNAEPDGPPPLAAVAKMVGVSTGGLEYLFPAISRGIKSDYQQWKTEERERKRVEAATAVMEYLASEQPKKCRKRALVYLRESTSLPKNVLLQAIAVAFSE